MQFTLDAYATWDDYTVQGELRVSPAQDQVTLTVLNNPVFAQFAVARPPGHHPEYYTYDATERRMIQGNYEWGLADFNGAKVVGIRVRSAVAGNPGVVTIHA